jgi:zinc protease
MGEGLDGRIMTVLREKKGLVYGAKTYTNFYEYSGEFVFSTKTKAENLKKVLPLLVSIIKDMITHGITREELKTAKGNFKGNVLLELQDIVTQAQHNGEEMLFSGAIVPYQDIFETFIEPLTVKNMNDMIQRYFTNQNMCVCILSEKLPSLEIVQNVCARII